MLATLSDSCAEEFVRWLRRPTQLRWMVDKGSEGLVRAILKIAHPSLLQVVGSMEREEFGDAPVEIRDTLGSAPLQSQQFDVVVAGYLERDASERLGQVMGWLKLTRLHGTVASIVGEDAGISREALWNLWLDAGLNNVSTQVFDDGGAPEASRHVFAVQGTR